MADRSAAVMDALLAIHRAREPRGLLSAFLGQLNPEYGPAVACCYLLDDGGHMLRQEFFDDGSGKVAQELLRADIRVPPTLPRIVAVSALTRLAETGDPVHVDERLPEFMGELWGEDVAVGVVRGLMMRFCAFAPVDSAEGVVGLVLLLVRDGWPLDVAAECTAHAAVALGNLVERRGMAPAAQADSRTGLPGLAHVEQVAARELSRADRYRRVLSLAVIEPPAGDDTEAGMAAAAELIKRIMRQPDVLARLGPRRLAVLLPEAPAGGGAAFVRRVEERAAADPRLAGLRGAAVAFPNDGRTWEALVRAAHARLDTPEPAAVPPTATIHGGLRAAFPSFGAVPDRPFGRSL